MTRILTLDLATHAGLALLVDGAIADYGALDFEIGIPKGTAFIRHPQILDRAHRVLGDVFDKKRPDFVVVEIPHLRGSSSFLTVALYGVAQLLCAQHQIGFYGVHTATWQSRIIPGKKAVDGDTKVRSKARARSLGFGVGDDDNVADAICIALWAAENVRIREAQAA